MSDFAIIHTALICSLIRLQAACTSVPSAHDPSSPRRCRQTRGQATTEYALILLAAALVGLMVVAWATAGGGAARISKLFNGVVDSVIDKV